LAVGNSASPLSYNLRERSEAGIGRSQNVSVFIGQGRGIAPAANRNSLLVQFVWLLRILTEQCKFPPVVFGIVHIGKNGGRRYV